jgi:hypothetical protein
MNSQIINAIKQKRVIELIYDGEIRIVEPHCYGLTTKGNEAIRAFQIDGYSSSGIMGWKMYDLSKADNIQIHAEIFAVRAGYKRGDKGMSRIFCEL